MPRLRLQGRCLHGSGTDWTPGMLRTLTRRLAESISTRAAYPPRGTGTGKTRSADT